MIIRSRQLEWEIQDNKMKQEFNNQLMDNRHIESIIQENDQLRNNQFIRQITKVSPGTTHNDTTVTNELNTTAENKPETRDNHLKSENPPVEIKDNVVVNNTASKVEKSSSEESITVMLHNLKEQVARMAQPQSSTPYKSFKRAQIPTFSGKPSENVRNWIFMMESRFEGEHIQSNEQIDIAMGYLRDLALETYRNMCSNGVKPSWQDLKKRFLKFFEPYNTRLKLRADLAKLKQGNGPDSYNHYTYEFQRLINQIDNMDVNDKMLNFINGLHPYTVKRIQEAHVETLEECMRIASSIETTLANAKYNKMMQLPRYQHGSSSKTQPFRGDLTSNDKQFNNNQENSKPKHDLAKIQCYKCKMHGHYSTSCPSKDEKFDTTVLKQ